MSRSDDDPDPDASGSSIQPDGGLLSVLGDLLFAGVILIMIYPFLRRTIERIDRQFFRQLFYILEVLFAVGSLCFVLMLLIAQQMRMTYCGLIRPYVERKPEKKVYAGIYLKVIVCALLVFNYFFASGLQRVVFYVRDWIQPPGPPEHTPAGDTSRPFGGGGEKGGGGGVGGGGKGGGGAAGVKHRRSRIFSSSPREVLSDNSNTNSQTRVTHVVAHSNDNLPSMSFPAVPSHSFQIQSNSPKCSPQCNPQRFVRDVGTMVRFPDYENDTDVCTLQFCRDGPRSPAPVGCHITSCNPPSSKSASSLLQPSYGASSGFHHSFHGGPPGRPQSGYHSCLHTDYHSSSDGSYASSTAACANGVLGGVRSSCRINYGRVGGYVPGGTLSTQPSGVRGEAWVPMTSLSDLEGIHSASHTDQLSDIATPSDPMSSDSAHKDLTSVSESDQAGPTFSGRTQPVGFAGRGILGGRTGGFDGCPGGVENDGRTGSGRGGSSNGRDSIIGRAGSFEGRDSLTGRAGSISGYPGGVETGSMCGCPGGVEDDGIRGRTSGMGGYPGAADNGGRTGVMSGRTVGTSAYSCGVENGCLNGRAGGMSGYPGGIQNGCIRGRAGPSENHFGRTAGISGYPNACRVESDIRISGRTGRGKSGWSNGAEMGSNVFVQTNPPSPSCGPRRSEPCVPQQNVHPSHHCISLQNIQTGQRCSSHNGHVLVQTNSLCEQAGCSYTTSSTFLLRTRPVPAPKKPRRFRLPLMPKMTRSGKIYGYG